jgi:two-component system chemotaxis response regulator CheY
MKTCLIVEDSRVICEIAARIVRDLGLDPRLAEEPEAGVDICRAETPDVVLLDWDLPKFGALDFLRGLAGLEPARRPHIILCATEYDAEQFTLARAAGAAHYVMKPFDATTIGEKFVEIGIVPGAAPQQSRVAS